MADEAGSRLCAFCGVRLPYDEWEEAFKPRCEMCGLPTAVSVGGTPVEDGTEIQSDVICRGCGYNLRGLRTGGQCAECARPINDSLQLEFLCFAPAKWVARLAVGCHWLERGVGISRTLILIFVLTGIIALAATLTVPALGPVIGAASLITGMVAMLGTCFCLIPITVGTWLVTAACPDMGVAREADRARRQTRTFLAVFIGALPLYSVLMALAPPICVAALLSIALIGVWGVGVLGVTAFFSLLGRLSEQVPAPDLRARADTLKTRFGWALAIAVVLAAVDTLTRLGPALIATGAPPQSAGGARLGAWTSLTSCAVFVTVLTLIWLVGLTAAFLRELTALLRQQARLAEKLAKDFGAAGSVGPG